MGQKSQKNHSLAGPLDMLILKTLTRGNLHGCAVVQRIQETSADEILIEESLLHPALQRLELRIVEH